MPDKHVVRVVLIIAFALIVMFGAGQYASVRKAEIERQREVEQAEIEREREIEVQIQKTERTEERSQFWQKIVPWGDDEEEENK